MRRQTHLAALRMASKVALSASVLACTAASTPISGTPATETKPAEPAAEKPSCETVIAKAFPTEGNYPGKKQDVSPDVVACCEQVLVEHMGGAAHRWDCCANVDPKSDKVHAACTPWGPPTPPSMTSDGAVTAGDMLDLREAARARRVAVPLIPELGGAAIATWLGRMVNEYASSHVFYALAEQLTTASIDAHEVAAFAQEERTHGVLCGAVVESLGGEARAELPPAPAFPLHEDAHSPLEAALRNVLSVCCLSETVAVALIGAERLEMPEGELRDVLTTIWSDEVGHARFGWRLLERLELDLATRERLGDYLAVAFAHLVEHELEHLPLSSTPTPEGALLGLCSGSAARALFFATVEEVIVPALEAHGLPASRAWLLSGGTARASAYRPSAAA